MSEHTKEPWRVECRNYPLADTGDYEGCVEIHAEGMRKPIVSLWEDNNFDESNARRIVACVNACEGLSDAELEGTYICARPLKQALLEYKADCSQLTRQRDELLAALKEAREYVARNVDALKIVLDDPRGWRTEQDDLDRIDALIARMEEGK